MDIRSFRPNMAHVLIGFVVFFSILLAITRRIQSNYPDYWKVPQHTSQTAAAAPTQIYSQAAIVPATRFPDQPILTPTPDAPRTLPTLRADTELFWVSAGDTLGNISKQYGVGLEQLARVNELTNPNLLEIGQQLTIPPPEPDGNAPDFKIIPDSELVYSPTAHSLDIQAFAQDLGGYLASYQEEVNEVPLSGPQIIEQISRNFSINPRLLMAVLEYQSGWLTNPSPGKAEKKYPLGIKDPNREGLYRQLAWAADNLNRGYYLWRVNGVGTWLLSDGSLLLIEPTINAGTAGVQHMFTALYGRENWEQAVSPDGLFTTYSALFGYPFDYTFEPLLPANLNQPQMQLPFEEDANWAFTGGPHGGYGEGSAWAALDFAPPGEALGCVQSNAWVTAVADGMIVRSENGVVIQDLDGDNLEGTGWVVLYLHIETRDRVPAGTYINAGERIGHPSCEGGISSGTHVHLARRYNGEWIPADQDPAFVLDGWVSVGAGVYYDGYLERDGHSIEAYAGRSDENGIQR